MRRQWSRYYRKEYKIYLISQMKFWNMYVYMYYGLLLLPKIWTSALKLFLEFLIYEGGIFQNHSGVKRMQHLIKAM